MMVRLTKFHNPGHKFLIAFNVFYRVVDDDYSSFFKSYIVFLDMAKSVY